MARTAKAKVKLPSLDLMEKIEDFKARQERGKETAPEIREWVKNAISDLEGTRKALKEIPEEEKASLSEVVLKEATISAILQILRWQKPLAEIADILCRRLSKGEEEAETKERVAEIMASVEKTMIGLCSPLPFKDSKDLAPNVIKAAWLGHYDFLLSYDISSLAALKNFFVTLKKDRYLAESPQGVIKFDGAVYDFPAESLFGKTEKDETGQIFRSLIHRVFEKEEGRLFSRSEITLQELWEGKKGLIALEVPEEIAVEDGRIFRRPGGPLLLMSNGEEIRPVQGLGGIKQKVEEIRNIKIGDKTLYLLRSSLALGFPPYLNGMPEDAVKGIRQLWRWIKRVGRSGNLLEEYKKAGTVTLKKWCLDKKPGVTLALFSGQFRINELEGTYKMVTHPFLLIERSMEEKVGKIQVVGVPDHLQGAFGYLLNKKYLEGREPEILRTFLRAVSNEVAGTARAAKKAEQISK